VSQFTTETICGFCTLLAARTWYANRGQPMEPAERQVFLRFVAGSWRSPAIWAAS
jgi:hypothetical protein